MGFESPVGLWSRGRRIAAVGNPGRDTGVAARQAAGDRGRGNFPGCLQNIFYSKVNMKWLVEINGDGDQDFEDVLQHLKDSLRGGALTYVSVFDQNM